MRWIAARWAKVVACFAGASESKPWAYAVRAALLAAALFGAAAPPAAAWQTESDWVAMRRAVLASFLREAVGDSLRAGQVTDSLMRLPFGDTLSITVQTGTALVRLDLVHDVPAFARFRGAAADVDRMTALAATHRDRHLLDISEGIRVGVDNARGPGDARDAILLRLLTVREYGCTGYRIIAGMETSVDRFRIRIRGVDPPPGLCGPAMTPAAGHFVLNARPGRSIVEIEYRDTVDVLVLEATEASLRLSAEDTTRTRPDERLKWRFPARSFAFRCVAYEAAALCARLTAWVESLDDVTRFRFGPHGVDPYRGGSYFRYAEEHAVRRVGGCVQYANRRLAALGDRMPTVTAELWTGDSLPSPAMAGDGADCAPFLPDPEAAAALSVDTDAAARYRGDWPYCPAVDTTRATSLSRTDLVSESFDFCERGIVEPAAPRSPPAGRPTVVRPIAIPDIFEREAPQQLTPSPHPIVVPPNTLQSALSRAKFNAWLREWWLRGGVAVGDPVRQPLRAWLWVKDGFDWYYLLGETTAEGVRAYLDRANREGPELIWGVLDDSAAGAQRVVFGRDDAPLPGFLLYRWRQ